MRDIARCVVKEFYEKTAEVYDKEYDEPYWKLYHEITWANIRRFLPVEKTHLLDAGGGTGYWAIRLAKRGFNVVSTDIAENMLKVAARKIEEEKLQDKIETRIADIRDCHVSNQAVLTWLLPREIRPYCLHPERAVRELARVVKDDSYVIVSVDSKYPIVSRLIREESFDELSLLLRTGRLKGDFMLQAFTPEEMRALFEACGLMLLE